MDRRTEIRDFLTSRRARITPEQAGLKVSPLAGVRRVAGLRREEVALLAGVSVPYYTRLERGDARGATDAVLDAIGPARSPAAPGRRQAPEPPARRAADVHLRDHGTRRRPGPVPHHVRYRTRQPGRGCAQPAGQLERHRQRTNSTQADLSTH